MADNAFSPPQTQLALQGIKSAEVLLQTPAGQRLIDTAGEAGKKVIFEAVNVYGDAAGVAIEKFAQMDADTITKISANTGDAFKNISEGAFASVERGLKTTEAVGSTAKKGVTGTRSLTSSLIHGLSFGYLGRDRDEEAERKKYMDERLAEINAKEAQGTPEKGFENLDRIGKIQRLKREYEKIYGSGEGECGCLSGWSYVRVVILVLALIMAMVWFWDSSTLWLDDPVFARRATIALGLIWVFMNLA